MKRATYYDELKQEVWSAPKHTIVLHVPEHVIAIGILSKKAIKRIKDVLKCYTLSSTELLALLELSPKFRYYYNKSSNDFSIEGHHMPIGIIRYRTENDIITSWRLMDLAILVKDYEQSQI